MTAIVSSALRADHLQLTHQLFYLLDEARYGELVELFAPHGVWHRQGEVLSGHAQILSAMARRSATQRIRHLVANTFVSSREGEVDHLTSYMVAYRFDSGTPQSSAPWIDGPLRLYIVRMAMTPWQGQLKLLEVSMAPEFEFKQPAGAPQ